MKQGILILTATSSLFLGLGAQATPVYINPLGENSSSAALSLQSLLDARGNTQINVYNDQLDTGVASTWQSTGVSGATVISAVAGSANINTFGIYDLADPTQKIQLFAGGMSGAVAALNSPWATFGFYIINENYGNIEYSDPALNGGQFHMVAYHGTSTGETLNLGSDPSSPTSTVFFDSNSYLLSWEDTDYSISDFDYNDLTVVVSYVSPAPDNFATVGGLGLAMLGLAFLRKAYPVRKTCQEKA